MSDNFFFHDERHFFLNNYRHLNFDSFNFSLMDFHLLIFDSIPISLNRDFFDYFNWNSSLDLDFNNFLFDYSCFHDSRDLDLFDIFLLHDDHLFHRDLDWNLNLLDDELRDLNFDYLKLYLFTNNNFLDNFGHLNDFFDDSWNYHNFFYDLLNFNNSRNLNNLFDDSINKLRLNLNDFSFYDNRNWFVNLYRLHNFLFCSYYLDIFNFYFLNFLAEVGLRNSFDYWYLFGDVKGYYLFNLYFLGS
jgi:hypothetical protein